MNQGEGDRRHERRRLADHAARVLAYAKQHRDGFYLPAALRELGISSATFRRAVQYNRDALEAKGETLWCGPSGWHGPWLWKLTADPELVLVWHLRHIRYDARKLRTRAHMASSGLKMCNPRSRIAKQYRVILKHLGRAIEDEADMREEAAL